MFEFVDNSICNGYQNGFPGRVYISFSDEKFWRSTVLAGTCGKT